MAANWNEFVSIDNLRDRLSLDYYAIAHGIVTAPVYHLVVEVLLIVWILKLLFFTKTFTPGKQHGLTDKEKEELIAEWQPEPLVPETFEDRPYGFKQEYSGVPGKRITINGKEYTNLISLNFLGMIGNKDIEKSTIESLRKYGVGSCGPRGFYGTVDVHLQLEERLAQFMRCEEAILYSYGFATVASAIPAYAKRGDVIFVDEGVCFSIQKGLESSRSVVKYFKHNNMEDLERLLKIQANEDKKDPRKAKATRRFLVVEGVYMNYGDICPLPKLIEYKYKYKLRLFVEESVSFGTLGDTGRGVTEHFGCNVEDIDMICANLENAVGSIGGFCCGTSYVIDHQRLSGLGYCFSASLPPLLATGAITALNLMENTTVIFSELHNKCKYLNGLLQSLKGLTCISDPVSPVQHLILSKPSNNRQNDMQLLERVVQFCMSRDLALTQSRYLDKFETFPPVPSIRVSLNVELSKQEIMNAADILKSACDKLL